MLDFIKMLYTEIQDGRQKWWEKFWENLPVASEDTLRLKNFDKIAKSCTVSKINVFLCLAHNFKMAPKIGRKAILGTVTSLVCD